MRLATPIKIGVPALVILAMAAVMAFMAWGNGAAGGLGETAFLNTNVKWTVYGSDGTLKSQGEGHNAASTFLLQDMRTRLTTAVTAAAANTYDDVALCDTNVNASAGEGFTPVVCDAVSGVYTTGLVANPDTDITPDNSGNGSTPTSVITAAFVANGAAQIREFQLVRNGSATEAISAEIGAVRDVSIDLISDDTLTIVWTINFAGS